MKKLILFTSLIFSYFSHAQTNDIYEVDYILQLDNEILNKSLKTMKDKSTKFFISKQAETFKEVQSKLVFNAKAAKYAVREQLRSDAKPKFNYFEGHAGGESIYYFDNMKNRSYFTSTLLSKTNVIYKNKWKILNETEEILGFTCYKAELILNQKGKIYAWFTKKIPFPYGPYTFNNLPGLILKAEVKNGLITYLATNIKRKKEGKPIIEKNDYRFLTESEYSKELKKNSLLLQDFE